MIARRMSILPSVSKNKERRLTLDKKQDVPQTMQKTSSTVNSDKVQLSKKQQSINFHVKRPARFSVNPKSLSFAPKKLAFELVLEAKENIRLRSYEKRSRSVSALLFGIQRFENSTQTIDRQNFNRRPKSQFFDTNTINFMEIPSQIEKPFSGDQKFNFGQLSVIRNQNSKSQLQDDNQIIKLKQQFYPNQELKQDVLLTLQKESEKTQETNNVYLSQKKYVSVGVSTELDMGTGSYKEYMKFKIMQTQKFDRLHHLFQSIQNVYKTQINLFSQRQQNINNGLQNTVLTKRQQGIQQVTTKKQLMQKELQDVLKTTISGLQQAKSAIFFENVKEFKKIQYQINRLNGCQQFSDQPLQQNVSSVKKNYFPSISNQQMQKQNSMNGMTSIVRVTELLRQFEEKKNNNFDKILEKIIQKFKTFQSKFESLKQVLEQKNFLLQGCISDIIKLPEMSMVIFGMDDQMKEERQTLKKIGIFLDDIPEFDNFYQRKDPCRNVDKKLANLLNIKCMNCSYLKSKIRFISSKNKDIQPVVRLLNNLIKTQRKNIY